MSLQDRAKKLPMLSEDNSGSLNGQYVVIPLQGEEHSLSAYGPDYEYSVWFKTPPLDSTTIDRIHSVQLVTESHDQGFCSEPNKGTWTWFELTIMENHRADKAKFKDEIELAWLSHTNKIETSAYNWKTGKKFSKNHDMFRLLEDGNVIAVRLCARFPGWQIVARTGYLVVELGIEVTRSPLNYGQIKSNVLTVQEVFKDVNELILPDSLPIASIPNELFQAEMMDTDSRPLRVLSLDGGGVRGIAALMLLKAVMAKGAPGKKPCEVFDLIGGTSTGGFIAIMLGRLKMSIDDCLRKYKEFMNVVFPKKAAFWKMKDIFWSGSKWDAKPLEDVIKILIKDTIGGDPETVTLMDDDSRKDNCKVFVMAVNQIGANNHAPVVFRSYKNPLEMSELPNIKLWEAARATSAAPMYFEPLKVGDRTFVDGGLQANNPLGWLWNEVLSLHGPSRSTNCFLSIGTGVPLSKSLSDVRNLPAFTDGVAGIASNSEISNILFRSLINAFAPNGMAKKYWRFNVGDGLPDWVEDEHQKGVWRWRLREERREEDVGALDDTGAIPETERRAREYLELPGAKGLVEECAGSLGR